MMKNHTMQGEVMRYRRAWVKGGTFFFTVVLINRKQDLLVRHINILRGAVRRVRKNHPFTIVAMVVLPEHLHAIWQLPQDDTNYPLRWSLIKACFSRALPKTEPIHPSRARKQERGIWQRRYWEHQIRNETDLQHHVDYIHYNPVKHGYTVRPADWPFSSIHQYIADGVLPEDWGCGEMDMLRSYGE